MKLNARLAAYSALLELLKSGSEVVSSPYSVLNNLGGFDNLAELDRNLATEITMGVLRHRTELERLTKPFCTKKPPREVNILIISAVYQLCFLDRVPAHAVLNETVAIAKASVRTQNYAGLINAVLHKFIEKEPDMPKPSTDFSLPEWLRQRWTAQFGTEKVRDILASLAQPQIAGIWFNHMSDDGTDIFEDLVESENVEAWSVGNDELITVNPENPPNLDYDSLTDCLLGIGLSSQIVSVLIADGTLAGGVFGGRMLDLCAGYGHKSIILRSLLGTDFKYHINDIDQPKVDKTAELFELWGFEEPSTHFIDITKEQSQMQLAAQGRFDLIVVDAPCTGTGTFRRLPNKAQAIDERNIVQAAELQSQLLINASRLLNPGGILAYSVCSLEYEEGYSQIETLMKSSKQRWQLRDVYLWDDVEFAVQTTDYGYYLLPIDNALEGFFLAILKSE